MKKLQRDRRGNSRVQRAQLWAQKIKAKVARSTQAFMERRAQRLAWWKRTFRVPQIGHRWLFTQASSLWAAFMSLLGLVSRGPKIKTRDTRFATRRDSLPKVWSQDN